MRNKTRHHMWVTGEGNDGYEDVQHLIRSTFVKGWNIVTHTVNYYITLFWVSKEVI